MAATQIVQTTTLTIELFYSTPADPVSHVIFLSTWTDFEGFYTGLRAGGGNIVKLQYSYDQGQNYYRLV